MKKFSVILPTFNESENITVLIEQILALKNPQIAEIIVVDDNSPDGTYQKVVHHFENNPLVKVVLRLKNRGLTNSLNEGINKALGDVVLWMDSDLQMPTSLIPKLIEKHNQGQRVVIGSRFFQDGQDQRFNGNGIIVLIHKILSKLMCYTFYYLFRLPVLDISSGYIAIEKNIFENYKLEGDYGEYFLALVIHLKKQKIPMIEIPYTLGVRKYGESKTQENGLWGLIKIGFGFLKKALRL